MDRLWRPWRYAYIASNAENRSQEKPACVFCSLLEEGGDDRGKFILHRAAHNFVILNLYPYVSGHLMIVPFAHLPEFDEAPEEVTTEMMNLAKRCKTALAEVYKPHGYNLGMNLGRAAGAGVDQHIHLHILPRWVGDTNFMSAVGETRVLPEDLEATYDKLVGKI